MAIDQDELVRFAGELEPLPSTVTRLAQILAQADWDMREVEEVISLDQLLTPRLLRLANSALAARGHPIATVREAVLRVGTGPIFSMAMALGVERRLKRAIKAYGLVEGALWIHSVGAALAVETMGSLSKTPIPVESFTAALLHDIGKLVMARFLEPEWLRLIHLAELDGGLSRRNAEVEILGVEHGELGALVAQHWKLPDRIVIGIHYHHTPQETCDPIAAVVNVADAIANAVTAKRDGQFSGAAGCKADPGALDLLGINGRRFDQLCTSMSERLGEVLAKYN